MHFVKQGAGGPWGRQATNCRLGYVPAILERRDISPGPVEPGGRGQILADQLTLFRQGRGQIMLTILKLAPSPPRILDGPPALKMLHTYHAMHRAYLKCYLLDALYRLTGTYLFTF